MTGKRADGRRWEAAEEAAWTQVRRDVADALAVLEEGEAVLLEWGPELLGPEIEDESERCAPYVQAIAWGKDMLRIEAASNHYLCEPFVLGSMQVEALVDLGWWEPTDALDHEADGGSVNFWVDLEVREADRAAVLLVRALREVYGCLHPTLLSTTGLYPESAGDHGGWKGGEEADDTSVAAFDDLGLCWPSDRAELEAAVLTALGVLRGEPVEPDADGDVPVPVGRSLAFVRVMSGRPGIELFAYLVTDLEDADPQVLARELNILNRQHETFSFYAVDDLVLMRQVLIAVPFVPLHLKIALESFCGGLDNVARDLVERVGGRRFLEGLGEVDETDEEAEPTEQVDSRVAVGDGVTHDAAVAALIEMLRDGRLPTRSVIELFDGDRGRLTQALSGVRSGVIGCEPTQPERVLESLRRAARAVTRADAERSRVDRHRADGERRLSILEHESRRRA